MLVTLRHWIVMIFCMLSVLWYKKVDTYFSVVLWPVDGRLNRTWTSERSKSEIACRETNFVICIIINKYFFSLVRPLAGIFYSTSIAKAGKRLRVSLLILY